MARSTVQRIERGLLRPRPSTVALIAAALDPDRRAEIRGRLIAAAGDDLAPRNEAWSRYQVRRLQGALESGDVPLPVADDRRLRLFTAGESMRRAAMALDDIAAEMIDEPGPQFDDLMCLGDALRAEAEQLHNEAATIFGGMARPLRRWRGDPADVSPLPPPLSDLGAVWRWLWEWQCREGRLRPRSARERAIAATGQQERETARNTPEVPPQPPEDPRGRGSQDLDLRARSTGRSRKTRAWGPIRHIGHGAGVWFDRSNPKRARGRRRSGFLHDVRTWTTWFQPADTQVEINAPRSIMVARLSWRPMKRICLAAVAAAAMCAALPACSSSPAPNPRDVQACKDVKADLAAIDEDSLHYYMDSAIASTKLLQQAIEDIGNAIALRPVVGYGEENEAITITAKLCSQDGVSGVGQ
jgi:hypothetical protein